MKFQVLDIKKLASEMDLNCITTYKLDALKACRRTCEDSDLPILDVSDEVQSTPSDPLGSGMDKTQDTSTNGLDAELISQTKCEYCTHVMKISNCSFFTLVNHLYLQMQIGNLIPSCMFWS